MQVAAVRPRLPVHRADKQQDYTETWILGKEVYDYTGPEDALSHPKHRALLRPLATAVSSLAYRMEVEGDENFPHEGAHVYAPTHPSMMDPMFIFRLSNRDIRYMANVDAFTKTRGKLMTWAGAFPVNIDHGSLVTIRHSIDLLKQGIGLCLFPEAGNPEEQREGRIGPFKRGAAEIAVRGRAETVVPIAVHYSPDTKSRPLETAAGWMAAAAVTAAGVAGAMGGPGARIAAGAVTGALTGGYVLGRRLHEKTESWAWFDPFPKLFAAMKGAALGSLAGAAAGGLAAAVLPPGAGVGLALCGGWATRETAAAWRDRDIAHVVIEKPLVVQDYVDRHGKREAAEFLTSDLHHILGKTTERLSGVPYRP